MALIENIQRENLNLIDEAHAYRRLSEEFHSQEDIATRREGPCVCGQLRRLLSFLIVARRLRPGR